MQVEQLFMRFVRGDALLIPGTGGISLGLASVCATVLAHCGSIELINLFEHGLRMSVYLRGGFG